MDAIQKALAAFSRGGFVVLHDGAGRENEADLLCLAEKITPKKVRTLRKDAGGLICLSTDSMAAKRLGLPFAAEVLSRSKSGLLSTMCRRKAKYGDYPAFSVSINHCGTFTGITDNDRALTIGEFGRLVARKGGRKEFAQHFRAIGHVFLLVGRGLERRKGHTELSIALADLSGATPAVALCEILSDTGRAASRKEAMAYAKRNGFPFVDGKQIIKAAGVS